MIKELLPLYLLPNRLSARTLLHKTGEAEVFCLILIFYLNNLSKDFREIFALYGFSAY